MGAHKIAVIMSVYHSDDPQMFKTAVNSILEQSICCDLLVYRDGPIPTELNEILSTLGSLNNVFIFHSDENKGLATGLNFLIDYAIKECYSFIARMDSDDVSYPKRLETQVEFFENNRDIDVLGTSCRELGASFALNEKHLPKSHDELLRFSITRCPFIHPTVMFRNRVFEKGIRYPVNTTLTEDMALWFDLLNSDFKFANIHEILLDYRLDEDTIFRRQGISKAVSELKIRTKNMFLLKQFNAKNVLLISFRLVFHMLPASLVKFAYKKAR